MKKIFLATAFSAVALTARADGYSEPVIVPEIVVEDTVRSGGDDWVVIMMTLVTIGAALVMN